MPTAPRRPSPRRRVALQIAWIACLLGTLAGCHSGQRKMTHEEMVQRRDAVIRDYESALTVMEAGSGTRIGVELRQSIESGGTIPQSHDILILSGGGAKGAFGTGFLEGWGQVTDAEFTRPEFDVVSGISTGSLIAPFAFVGDDESYRQVSDFYRNPNANWARRRGLIPILPSNLSMYDVRGLECTVRACITPDIAEGVAAGGRDGRQLLVGATNLDYGMLRVFDIAAELEHLTTADGQDRIASLLLASAAIPAAFPLVMIDDHMYVDGGTSMQFVGGLEQRDWLFEPEHQVLGWREGMPPIRIRVWVIVNQKLLPDPELVPRRWVPIASRSLSTLLRSSLLTSIQDSQLFIRALNRRPEFDAALYFVAIPQDFDIPTGKSLFEREPMRALNDLGRRIGADPQSWQSYNIRSGAAFESTP